MRTTVDISDVLLYHSSRAGVLWRANGLFPAGDPRANSARNFAQPLTDRTAPFLQLVTAFFVLTGREMRKRQQKGSH
jgi:hypothetical protein